MAELLARFHFTRFRRAATYMAALFCAFSSLLVAAGAALALPHLDRPRLWFALAVTGLIAVYLGSIARLWLKYSYIMYLEYDVSARGISVREQGQVYSVPWEDIETAEFMPMVSVFRLRPVNEHRPIVLFTLELGGYNDPASRRSRIASRHIRDGLRGRLRNRWLPW
jgi:hypothetical protein